MSRAIRTLLLGAASLGCAASPPPAPDPVPITPLRSCRGTGGDLMPEPDCEGWVEDRSRPEGVTDEDEALGRERFQRGVTAFREGHYAAARFEFLWAYELTRRAALLYNASLAMDRLGQQQEAEATIHRLYGELDPCHPIARELRMRGYHPPP